MALHRYSTLPAKDSLGSGEAPERGWRDWSPEEKVIWCVCLHKDIMFGITGL